jgi:predicted AlkP superfamily phosphohydrolase/phosphomutase
MSILAYIGPGAGITVAGSLLALVLCVLAGALGLLFFPVRAWRRARARRRRELPPLARRVVVLGMDGLDPGRVRRYMDMGILPNFARLAREGSFDKLGTTFPAVSPVAWSTFQTGTNPGKHRVFDFLRRDPGNLAVLDGCTETQRESRMLSLRGVSPSLGSRRSKPRRKAPPFWAALGSYGLSSEVINVPVTYPLEVFAGACLSGLGVPDILGTQGTFTCFTTDEHEAASGDPTGGRFVLLKQDRDVLRGTIRGPSAGSGPEHPLEIAIEIELESDGHVLRVQHNRVPLRQGCTTGWFHLVFRAGPFRRIRGMCQFRLLAVEPHFRLYMTPIHVDPHSPAVAISHPRIYSMYKAKLLGDFPTLGFAENTWAVNAGVLDPEGFIEQCIGYHEKRADLFYHSLRERQSDLLVCVFDVTDRIQHMFMASSSEEDKGDQPSESQIASIYRRMDKHVGTVLDMAGQNTVVIILSDHGFRRFERCVNLNGWLRREGYLAPAPDGADDGKYLRGIDWSKTQAYALGFGGIYINRAGRERQGIVARAQAETLMAEIKSRLETLQDGTRCARPIARVYKTANLYSGPYADEAPDLIVGCNEPYRVSWTSAMGGIEDDVFADNPYTWDGDHCMDPPAMSGVFLCNRRLIGGKPHLRDIAPTVLNLFGIAKPTHMDGKVLQLGQTNG